MKKWERETYSSGRPVYVFPELDLLARLVDAYFEHSNLILPVLHRPTLERGIQHGQHFLDEAFGGVVLLVCAIGSRFISDPRVLVPGSNSLLSAGWIYFSQVRTTAKLLITTSRLHDLQITCVRAQFLALVGY